MTRDGAEPSAIAEIFVDESSQTRHRYLLLGGVIVPPGVAPGAADAIRQARAQLLPHGEMKWGKVSQSKLPAYQSVIDAFFTNPAMRQIHFHSIIIERTGYATANSTQETGRSDSTKRSTN